MTATRFDTDNMNTPATRALAEAEPILEPRIAKFADELREKANGMTIAELRDLVTLSQYDAKPATKADWVERFVKQEVAKTSSAKSLAEKRDAVSNDRRIMMALNEFMNDADKAREEIANLSSIHVSSQARHLRSAHIAIHLGDIAADILQGVTEHDADLGDLTRKTVIAAIRIVLRSLGGGLRSEEEIAANDRFRDRMIYRMPEFAISSNDLA